MPTKKHRKGNGARVYYTTEDRVRAVTAFQQSGMTYVEFCQSWGVSEPALRNWLAAYDQGGETALAAFAKNNGRPKGTGKPIPGSVKRAVVQAKQKHPYFGVKRIRDWCARFVGIGVSRRAVESTLAEAQIKPEKKRKRAKPKQIRRFERAKPMQMWQSDITQFVCPRTEKRVFLCVFLDDCTRYVAGWAVAPAPTAELVMAAYEFGVTRYGRPEEALTDQGRQYVSWRGETAFQKKLKQDGVRHVVSRSHHPQTLGKCERLWKTINEEFWTQVEVVGVEDARERLEHWFGNYNFFRQHQGLDSATPADRFFGVEANVRQVIEETVQKNAAALAVAERPRQPFYLSAQIGETQVAVAADRGGLVLSTGEETKRLPFEDLGEVMAQALPESEPESAPDSPMAEEPLPMPVEPTAEAADAIY